MIHPLIAGNLKDDPARLLRSGLLVSIQTSVLLVRIAIVDASPNTRGQAVIAHWMSGLLGIVFWIAFVVAVLVKHVDVVERSRDVGLLRILGATDAYIVRLLLQESVLESIPGALLGLVFGYILGGLFEVLLGGSISMLIPFRWWPAVAAIAILASIAGALSAIPKAIRDGVAEALQ